MSPDTHGRWFFDNSGYYCYVLVGGTEDYYKEVNSKLRQARLKVLRSGLSYRPASNGVQYHWYIRVEHVTRDRIAQILGPTPATTVQPHAVSAAASATTQPGVTVSPPSKVIPRKETPSPAQAELNRLKTVEEQHQALRSEYDKQRSEHQEYRAKTAALESELIKAKGEVHTLRAEIRRMQSEQEQQVQQLKSQLSQAKRQGEALQIQYEELRAAQQRASEEAVATLQHHYQQQLNELELRFRENESSLNEAIQRLNDNLRHERAEHEEWFETIDPELRKKDDQIQALQVERNGLGQSCANLAAQLGAIEESERSLKQEATVLERENAELNNRLEQLRTAALEDEEKRSAFEFFSVMARTCLPEIEFLPGTLETLYHEVPCPEAVVADIKSLNSLETRGTRLEGAKDWLELHTAGDWRLYYQRHNGADGFRVFVSSKGTQKRDIRWLKQQ